MTQEEWLACNQPDKMLNFLRGKTSERKCRLFACACCRRIWHLMTDERSRKAVEIAERHCDGRSDRPSPPRTVADVAHTAAVELNVRASTATRGIERQRSEAAMRAAATAAAVLQQSSVWNYSTAAELAASQAAVVAPTAVKFAARSIGAAGRPAAKRERCHLSAILRDIMGNPFCTIVVEPSWLAWNMGTVRMLAQAIHEDRAYDRLPVLGDALEDAGCTDAEILAHCRGPGPHVLGCWVVDLLLGNDGLERCGPASSKPRSLPVDTIRNTTVTIRRSYHDGPHPNP